MRSDVMRAPLAHTDCASSTSTARRAWVRAVLALSLGASGLGRPSATRAATLAVGQPAPSLVLHTLDGRIISTADLLGKVIILTFWATWCEPCRDELPLLSAYAARGSGSSSARVQSGWSRRSVCGSRGCSGLELSSGSAGQLLGRRLWAHVAHSSELHDWTYGPPGGQRMGRQISRLDIRAPATRYHATFAAIDA
jgi:hypothetical protein